jgi:acetyltransferase-like isoleucine patch superfamily enzyme
VSAPDATDDSDGPDGVRGDALADDAEHRHDRTTSHPTPGPRNSLQHWREAKSVPRVVVNYLFVLVARLAPFLPVKAWALRRIGVTVGTGVSWGLEATPDVFWPELVTLEDDCIVGYDAVLLCHEFLQEEYRTGEVVVGERAMIGAKAVVLPGVHVGADAQVAANSLVADDVPAGATVAGVPAEVVGASGAEDGEDARNAEDAEDAEDTQGRAGADAAGDGD